MAYQPAPNPDNVYIFGKARFTFLTSRMVRLEWAGDGQFEDRATFAAVHRHLPKVPVKVREKGSTLTLETGPLTLTYHEDGRPFHRQSLSANFKVGGIKGSWYFGQKDRGNLLGTYETLDEIDGDQKRVWIPKSEMDPAKPVLLERGSGTTAVVWQGDSRPISLHPGLLSRDGWTVFDDGHSVVLDPTACPWQPWPVERAHGERQDLYLLTYGHDFPAALREASLVFGAQPVPPRYALGYWYSRYWAYTDKEIEELVRQFDTYGVPLDVMVIDMDWHKLGWTGYSWDEDYFPDYREFLRWLKERDLKISLNLHPADGVFSFENAFPAMCKAMGLRASDLPRIEPLYDRLYKLLGLNPEEAKRIPLDICDPNYMQAYFRCLHHPLEKEGVDFWWMDWQQGNQGSQLPNLRTLPWINELHWQDQARRQPNERPLNFSRYGGLGAGRMPVGFSGDTIVTWESLAYQPYFTATASNVLYGYWSHDIGGHMGGIRSPELYTRWIQFGLYSPILRTHTSKDPSSDRRVFAFDDPYKSVMIGALRHRYALLPYLYTEVRATEENGISLVHPLYYHYPEEKAAYQARDQYFFGRQMIVAPVLQPADEKDEMAKVKFWLPPGEWIDTATGEWLSGGSFHQRRYLLNEIPVFVRPGAVWAEQTPPLRVRPGSYADLVFQLYPGAAGAFTLREDDGHSLNYRKGEEATLTIEHETKGGTWTITLDKARGDFTGFLPRRPVTLRLNATLPPKGVTFGGRELPWSHRPRTGHWSYDGDSTTLVITLGEIDLRRSHTLTISAARGTSTQAINGFRGLMNRLERVRYYNCLVSPPRPLIAEERLAVRIAQTGNRISRQPATLKQELLQMEKDLARLPSVLREYQQAYREKGLSGEGPSTILQKATDILKATLRQRPSTRASR